MSLSDIPYDMTSIMDFYYKTNRRKDKNRIFIHGIPNFRLSYNNHNGEDGTKFKYLCLIHLFCAIKSV